MDKYLIIDIYEGEYDNYEIAFLAIPLTQGYVGLLASRFASCQPAFEAGAYQVKFFDASAGVVDYQGVTEHMHRVVDKSKPSDKWWAPSVLSSWLDSCVAGTVVHISEENQELLGYYRHQILTIDRDGNVWFMVASKNGNFADSEKVSLADLGWLVGVKMPEMLEEKWVE